jgi:2-dehydro-3-deoxyphosphogalactonate aldolase
MNTIKNLGLIAVLRGITPDEVIAVSTALLNAGWGAIEITLNSPDAYDSLEILFKNFKGKCLIGAGTVLCPDEVKKIADIGLDFVISPNMNCDVIRETKNQGLLSIPGIFTPSEAFTALDCGADALKIFPGESINPSFIKAIRAVLPPQTVIYVTGGIDTNNMQTFLKAGANGFGIGGSVYKPNLVCDTVEKNAKSLSNAFANANGFGLNLE